MGSLFWSAYFENLGGGNFGGRCNGTNELTLMFFEFKERWVRPKLNLAALVTMRDQGMSLREISRVTGVPRTTLYHHIKTIL